jgi:hypothetical protein
MKNLKLEARGIPGRKKVKALFERDPEIIVGEIVEPGDGKANYLFAIEVRNHEKFLALGPCFSPNVSSSENVTLAVNLYDEENSAGTADVRRTSMRPFSEATPS